MPVRIIDTEVKQNKSSSDVKLVLERVCEVILFAEGRDNLCKLMQYFSRMMKHLLSSSNPSLSKNFGDF